MSKKISPKFKRGLSITGRVVGTISFVLVVFALFATWIVPSEHVVSPNQVTSQMDDNPGKLPKNVVVKSKVTKIKNVPLYGYGYEVSDNMYIVNFSRGDLKVGDKVKFKVTGYFKVGDVYLVNADYE